MSAIILAGGKSTRMNNDKALIPISGVTLIEKTTRILEKHFGEVIISARQRKMFSFLPYPIVTDERLNCGPLMGIFSGLKASTHNMNFVMACDIPEVNLTFIDKMSAFCKGHDIVVPVSDGTKYEPLFAFYNKSVVPAIEDLLSRNIKKISMLFSTCTTKYVPFENNGWYYNLNTKQDYLGYLTSKKWNRQRSIDG